MIQWKMLNPSKHITYNDDHVSHWSWTAKNPTKIFGQKILEVYYCLRKTYPYKQLEADILSLFQNGVTWFFSTRIFFTRFQRFKLTIQEPAGERRKLSWFHSTTSTRSRTFKHLFETLYVRWLARIFIRATCIYQAATWLINDGMLISVYLHDFNLGL